MEEEEEEEENEVKKCKIKNGGEGHGGRGEVSPGDEVGRNKDPAETFKRVECGVRTRKATNRSGGPGSTGAERHLEKVVADALELPKAFVLLVR